MDNVNTMPGKMAPICFSRTISLADGSYELSGCARDFDWVAFNNQIEPFIFITHKCNGKSETVLVEVKVDRTDDYMTPEFDAGIMELSQATELE
ncbi:unnamed protein product [Bursaphelenchus xylophilus]|uniref:(pine wood nematode) hypothetical protein n=1 Tax=Bursaphelenchus xylophilus TaxID=6326 RepID=A0A7I8X8S6_BURXY|nr:unnamed protein product [Bursaphelenchus xylophilus]CAG9119304.1 unnamed protein product [Bursaphelenchus xylophilus]